jgi:hypothetical protein
MTDFENAGTVQGSNDTNNDGWTEDGNCAGNIYIFSGQDLRCRSWDALYNLSGHACCGGYIQLGRNFGSAESPNCQGFQVEDFEKLDFSKMDFTDAFDLPSSSDINGIISGLKNLGNNISK